MSLHKCALVLAVVILLALCLPTALAQEAPDLSAQCTFSSTDPKKEPSVLTDCSYKTYVTLQAQGDVAIGLPDKTPCEGLYINFFGYPLPYTVQRQQPDGQWVTVATPDPGIVNMYVPLPSVTGRLRVVTSGETRISELRVLGKGSLPGWVQTWRRMEGKADLMLIVAHPDDELVFLGGTLPYYCGQLHKRTMVVYMTTGFQRRRNELLDGLWTCGVRDYPELCEFRDGYTHLINYSFDLWGGRAKVYQKTAAFIRQYRPDVVVTLDIRNGEDTHGMHRAAADAAVNAVSFAADPTFDAPASQQTGVWQVKKLYVHLHDQRRIIMPWDQIKLSDYNGRTAADVAKQAFKQHVSQQKTRHKVYLCNPYDSRDFGLYFSTVGPDTQRADFFEHIPDSGR